LYMSHLNEDLYRTMYLIRACEEKIIKHYHENEMKTPVHLCIGAEAIYAGVIHALQEGDQLFGTYRNHGIYLAKTGDTDKFFGELLGRSCGQFLWLLQPLSLPPYPLRLDVLIPTKYRATING